MFVHHPPVLVPYDDIGIMAAAISLLFFHHWVIYFIPFYWLSGIKNLVEM